MLDPFRRLADMTASFKSFAKTYFGIGAALCALAIYQTEAQTEAFLKIRTRYKWALLMLLFGVNAVMGLYIVLRQDYGESVRRRIHLKPPPPVEAGTATWAGRAPFVRAPGTCSSRTAWKFVPPKP